MQIFEQKKSRVRMPGFSNQQKGCFAVIVFLKQFLAPLPFRGNEIPLQVVANVARQLLQVKVSGKFLGFRI